MKTRTSFLVMFMILTYYSSKCQTYYPLVQTNKVWTISYYFSFPPSQIKFMKISGDTTINSKVYNKVLQTNDSVNNPWTLDGYIRETNDHKVYFSTNPNISEFLYYNFNLALGDSVYIRGLPNPFIADTVDSVQVSNEEFRKRVVLSACSGYDTWIEGIGSLFGLIYSGENCLVGETDKLVCMLQNDAIVYHDPHYVTCSTPLYIPDIHDDSFVIYPNPVLDNLYINSNFKNTMILKLTDILGEVKWQTSLSSGENVINLSNCNKGIYIIEIYSTSQNIDVRRKIIKN